jgi:hypothetical protein
VGRLALAEGGLERRAYSCKVTVGLDPVTGDTLGHGKHGAVGTVTGKPYGVLSSSLAGTDGRIVAKVALDVSDHDMTVDAISRHKTLTSDVDMFFEGFILITVARVWHQVPRALATSRVIFSAPAARDWWRFDVPGSI